eukprot:s630_g15.t1
MSCSQWQLEELSRCWRFHPLLMGGEVLPSVTASPVTAWSTLEIQQTLVLRDSIGFKDPAMSRKCMAQRLIRYFTILGPCPESLQEGLKSLEEGILANTCMPASSNQRDGDLSEVSIAISGLDITVRGPAALLPEALSRITGSLAGLRALSPESNHSFEAVSSVAESSVPAPAPKALSRPGFRREARAEIAATFQPCPSLWISAAVRLTGSHLSGRARIERAWTAGFWARATAEDRVVSPCRSEPLDLRSRFYAVVKCEGVDCPVVYRSSASYWRAIGSFTNSSSISHSFPSELEARAYLSAAGFSEPFRFED